MTLAGRPCSARGSWTPSLISLVTEEEIAELLRTLPARGRPDGRAVLPLDEEAGEDGLRQLGDVVIAPAVAARNHPDDPASELRGCCSSTGSCTWLGHDHMERADRASMWALMGRWWWSRTGSGCWSPRSSSSGRCSPSPRRRLTRMTRVRALALVEDGRRNAVVLERLEADPPRFLNAVYLTMLCQNGSAIIVAILAERQFGGLGITLVSVGFTLLYFVIVEAMSKTFGVLHLDRAALAVAPLVVPWPAAGGADHRPDSSRERAPTRQGPEAGSLCVRGRPPPMAEAGITRRVRSSARRWSWSTRSSSSATRSCAR